jgi:hypothetical protein
MATPSMLTTTEVIGENGVIQQLLTLFGCNNMGSAQGGIVNALEHHTTT